MYSAHEVFAGGNADVIMITLQSYDVESPIANRFLIKLHTRLSSGHNLTLAR